MSGLFERSREGVTIPRIWLAVAFSILLHVAVLWKWMPQLPEFDGAEQGRGSLSVQLAPPPAPRVLPAEPPAQAAPKIIARPPQPKVRPLPQAPPVIALKKPPVAAVPPAWVVPAPAPVEVAPPARPPTEGDFFAAVEARRRAREGATAQPSPGAVEPAPMESEAARAKRIAAANLAPRQQSFGYDPAAGGGVFQMRSMGLNDAEFAFFGWNREIKRKTMQVIEVRRGNNSDIRIAVVRKMISIIRDYERDEFLWESRRLGRNMLLSARLRDNAGLEEFMLREFFPDQAVAR